MKNLGFICSTLVAAFSALSVLTLSPSANATFVRHDITASFGDNPLVPEYSGGHLEGWADIFKEDLAPDSPKGKFRITDFFFNVFDANNNQFGVFIPDEQESFLEVGSLGYGIKGGVANHSMFNPKKFALNLKFDTDEPNPKVVRDNAHALPGTFVPEESFLKLFDANSQEADLSVTSATSSVILPAQPVPEPSDAAGIPIALGCGWLLMKKKRASARRF